ncbi:MAG: hypothetical protein AAGG07_01555 [Planctomycetota bacterium]
MARLLGASLALVLLAAPGVASAQDEADRVRRIGGEEAIRAAMLDLRLIEEPAPEDYRVTRLALRVLESLAPEDVELQRRRVAAAWAEGDRAAALEETRRLVRLDPQDTVAQLRLIAEQIQSQSTVEGRLALSERYLGERGERLDASLRSRIAVDAAMLAREIGDTEKFTALLQRAMRLDRTNKEAASLTLNFFSARSPGNRARRVEMLINLLISDPVDPQIHLMLVNDLAATGSYATANLYMSMADALITRASGAPSPALDSQRLTLAWLEYGPEVVIQELTTRIAIYSGDAQQLMNEYERSGTPLPVDFVRPEDVKLSIPETEMLVLAAHASNNDALLIRALDDYLAIMAEELGRLLELAEIGGPDAASWNLEWHTQAIDLVRLLCIASPQDQEAARRFAAAALSAIGVAIGGAENTGPFADEHRAWRLWLQGDRVGAIAGLRASPKIGRWLASEAGVAIGLLAVGEPEECVRVIATATAEQPTDAFAAWMRSFCMGALSIEPVDARVRDQVAVLTAAVPRWAFEACQQPATYQRLRADRHADGRVLLEIANKAPAPLGLGSDRPIATPVMLSPRVTIGIEHRPDVGLPEVYDMSRRLRLMPRESVSTFVDPNRGAVMWLVDAMSHENRRVRWQVHQGYYVGELGMFEPGPMSLGTYVSTRELPMLEEASWDAATLAEAATTARGEALVRAAKATRSLSLNPLEREPVLAEAEVVPIAEAFASRYPALPEETRLALQAILPNARKCGAFQVFDEIALREPDPMIAVVAAIARADEESELVTIAARLQEQNAGEPAELVRLLASRTRDGVGGFAAADRRLNGLGRIDEIIAEVEAERERLRREAERNRE